MRTLPLIAVALLTACTRTPPEKTLDTAGLDAAQTDGDADGFSTTEGDCDDSDPASYPGAPESCDGRDEDCDGTIDNDVTSLWYADEDGDGFGDSNVVYDTCEPPEGAAAVGGDCDDASPNTYPGADEACNERDDDCDGEIDEDGRTTWYVDDDGDGFGDESSARQACAGAAGEIAVGGDCDDARADSHPGVSEICDELDNDCNGEVDEGVTTTAYADLDGDGYGDTDLAQEACTLPTGYAWADSDCDDLDASVSPAALETCDGLDDDCDGTVDEADAVDASVWYADTDADGHGTASVSTRACTAPAGYVAGATDCDDARADVSPDGTEICGGVDEDCDGTVDEASAADARTWYTDADADLYGDASIPTRACTAPAGTVADATDCDDAASRVNPAATEVCNGIDDDCDGTSDESGASGAGTWYADSDGDGYGNASSPVVACTAPSGYVASARDCDDTRSGVSPSGTEACNGLDDDCDGAADEAGATGETTWYRDADGDGWGSGTTTLRCSAPAGYVAATGDCNDGAGTTYPGASETCDGVDNDCDGSVDVGYDADGDGIANCYERSHSVEIWLTADDVWEGWVDGASLGSNAGWNTTERYTLTMDSGPHVFAVRAWDSGAAIAGFTSVAWVDGAVTSRTGDGTWHVSGTVPGGTTWHDYAYDDSGWGTGSGCGSSLISSFWGGQPADILGTGATWIWPRGCTSLGEGAFRLELWLP